MTIFTWKNYCKWYLSVVVSLENGALTRQRSSANRSTRCREKRAAHARLDAAGLEDRAANQNASFIGRGRRKLNEQFKRMKEDEKRGRKWVFSNDF